MNIQLPEAFSPMYIKCISNFHIDANESKINNVYLGKYYRVRSIMDDQITILNYREDEIKYPTSAFDLSSLTTTIDIGSIDFGISDSKSTYDTLSVIEIEVILKALHYMTKIAPRSANMISQSETYSLIEPESSFLFTKKETHIAMAIMSQLLSLLRLVYGIPERT